MDVYFIKKNKRLTYNMITNILHQNIRLFIAFLIFVLGLYVVSTHTHDNITEGFDENDKYKCPNLLIKKQDLLYLFHKGEPEIPGINPLVFESLDDYVQHIKYQRSQGIRCPVLYLQHTYSTNGKPIYRVYPSPEHVNSGLPLQQSNIEVERNLIDAGYTEGNMPGYDYYGFDNGVNTPLDKIYHSPEIVSDNPMDTNWGGVVHSRKIIESGKYKDNMRSIDDTNLYTQTSIIPNDIGLKTPLPTINNVNGEDVSHIN
jgi:hypothetical protein